MSQLYFQGFIKKSTSLFEELLESELICFKTLHMFVNTVNSAYLTLWKRYYIQLADLVCDRNIHYLLYSRNQIFPSWLPEKIVTTSSLGNLKIISRPSVWPNKLLQISQQWTVTFLPFLWPNLTGPDESLHISTMWHQFYTRHAPWIKLHSINTLINVSPNPSHGFQLWLPGLFKAIFLLTTQKHNTEGIHF